MKCDTKSSIIGYNKSLLSFSIDDQNRILVYSRNHHGRIVATYYTQKDIKKLIPILIEMCDAPMDHDYNVETSG